MQFRASNINSHRNFEAYQHVVKGSVDSFSYLAEMLFIYCHTELSLAFYLEVPHVVLSHLVEAI